MFRKNYKDFTIIVGWVIGGLGFYIFFKEIKGTIKGIVNYLKEIHWVKDKFSHISEILGIKESSVNAVLDKFNIFSLDDLLIILRAYQDYVSTLSIEQTFALAHLSLFFVLFSSVLNLSFVFYGEYLIKKFNIVNKYPKLGKIIAIRSKFQHFYFA